MLALTLKQVISFLSGLKVNPSAHKVLIDGEQKGTCTKASFRSVFGITGVEFPVDYSYTLDGKETKLSSRLRSQGLGTGGRERITVDGADVQDDDVLVGFQADGIAPSAYVEFRYTKDGQKHSVKFVAPLDKAEG